MQILIVGFVIGVYSLQMQAALPAYSILLGCVAAALACGACAHICRRALVKAALLLGTGALLGWVWAAGFAHHYLAQQLPSALEGRDIEVVGVVDSLPTHFARGVRFDFAVEQVLTRAEATAAALPTRLALSWYEDTYRNDVQDSDAKAIRNLQNHIPSNVQNNVQSKLQNSLPRSIQPGARWQLTVRLRRPHGNANPNGFDYEAWLLGQNLRATGYVPPDQSSSFKNQQLQAFVWSVDHVVQRSRSWLRERIYAALPDKHYASVIVALVIGDQQNIEQADWTVFNRTGIGHLISISGLHITMVAGLAAALVFALWRRSFFTQAQLPLWLPAQKAAALAGAAIALIYVALAGFGAPAQRTLYMLSVVALALWGGRIASVSQVVCCALGAVVLLDPWAVLWPGFWLSFCAVAVILYVSVGRVGQPSVVRAAVDVQMAVTLGLLPFTLLLFGQVSLISPLANAVAIPLVSFAVTPLALLGSIAPAPVAGWLLNLAHIFIEWLAAALSWLSSFPAAVWSAPLPSGWMFGLALLGTLWLLAPRGWPLCWLGLATWLPLLLNTPTHPKTGEMWVTAFDVGQGMALLIETPQHRLLYDTGPMYSPEADGGNRVLLPYLKARGIAALDAMIVSHSDADHSGGALSLLKEMPIGQTWSSLPPTHAIVQASAAHQRCEAGQSWTWEGVRFDMLHPSATSYASDKWKPNARSCTLKITIGQQSILLPGDIEAVQEAELLERDRAALRSSVLLAPHHGSGTSSTLEFLQAVQPELALFQVGYRNRYRHPKQQVFERYGELGVRRLRTDESGAISLRFSADFGAQLEVSEYRRQHARYWYGR